MIILVYKKGGDNCLLRQEYTKAGLQALKEEAKKEGHVGFLDGYREVPLPRVRVIVFFEQEPLVGEVERRRSNGFKGTRWYRL